MLKQLVDRHVQCRYDLLRVADELPVQVLVERLYVAAVDVEEGVLQCCNLVQLLLVDWGVRMEDPPPVPVVLDNLSNWTWKIYN